MTDVAARAAAPDAAVAGRWARTGPGAHPDLLFAGWVAFALANVAVMVSLPDVGAVAFHVVWVSMSLVYGYQGWSTRRTAVVLAAVVVATGLAMAEFIRVENADRMELTEVPLMAAVFLAMVWHVRRRAAALVESEASARRERQAHELKELFVRNCSHEMRTPITVARGYAELVRGQLAGPQAQDDIDVVVDELDKLGGLARRLLMLADVYEAKEFDWAPVDLGALVQRTAQRWRPAANRDWRVDVPSTPVVADADESRLESALDALVENAVKFTTDGDTVLLRCRTGDREAVLEVEDGGIGFAASQEGRTQGASGRSGTGLGLAIVRAIAEAHGGALETVGRAGGGSVVRIVVPRRRPA